jgi:murein DD-endopeptidase MepM/ murein hydrolase activator NlpD
MTATPSPTPTPVAPLTLTPSTGPPTTRPVVPAVRYVFPVAGCRVSYGAAHHDYPATDIFARAGCAFVAPVAGRVDEVGTRDRWSGTTNRGADRGGLFVSVVGTDGVRYYGSHLRALAAGIRPGVRVTAGTRLGEVGSTGSARGTSPHLHFGISWPTGPGVWWVRRGTVPPYRYLRSWQRGGAESPAAEVAAARRRAGDDPACRSYC